MADNEHPTSSESYEQSRKLEENNPTLKKEGSDISLRVEGFDQLSGEEGYAKLANFMGRHSEQAIFRRFRALNCQNLLYLQAEIMYLSQQLKDFAGRDKQHEERRFFASHWWHLSQQTGEEAKEQWETVLSIREKLDAYNDAILKLSQIDKMEAPRRYDLNIFRIWYRRSSMGCYPLTSLDRTAWDEATEEDLVAINPRIPDDPFTQWFGDKQIPFFHKAIGKYFKRRDKNETELTYYKDDGVSIFMAIIATVVSSTLPIVSIVVLSHVDSDNLKLGLIATFSALFSAALAIFTAAQKHQIFTACAAYVIILFAVHFRR